MTLVIKNSQPLVPITVSHSSDGSIQFYIGSGVKLDAFEAVQLANYILDSQPEVVEKSAAPS